MKTLELKLKKDVLIVDAEGLEITQALIFNKFGNYNLSYYDYICKGSELTEEIASELCHNIGNCLTIEGNAYLDDEHDEEYFEFAKEAIISAVESKEFFWLKHNVRNFSLYDPRSKTGWHDLEEEDIITKQWQEAEEKTFKNPLIFVKK